MLAKSYCQFAINRKMKNLIRFLSLLFLTILSVYYTISLWIYQFFFNILLIILMFLIDILYRICQILEQINEVIVKSIYLINAKILDNLIPVYFIKKLNFTDVLHSIEKCLNEIHDKIEDKMF